VAATLKPSSDSDIKIEVWLPAANWNGKFQAVGNGGWNGTISYPAMSEALRKGYATSSTDTGHEGGSASFALGHPEKVVDFGYRSVHEMTVAAKAIVNAFYGSAPRYAYWNGCSAGGRQALKEAQMFPADYDGIIAGSPVADHIGRAAQASRVAKVLEQHPDARLTPAKAQALHEAVLAACDARDGVKDGVIGDPKACTFDPGTLRCKGADEASCLTAAQVETVRLLYSTATNPKNRRVIGGLAIGGELGWTDMGWSPAARSSGLDHFKYVVYQDADFDLQKFDFDAAIVKADEADKGTINALEPNLKAFFDRGGKILQYHGWTDPQVSPFNSVDYYTRVVGTMGARGVEGSYRLFMVPGMNHCQGGAGTDTFDKMAAIEQWVEQKKAPESIVASHSTDGKVDRTRPLCPYPQVAAYKGSGSTDDASNFVCKVQQPGSTR
jgi:feruloyl esterase